MPVVLTSIPIPFSHTLTLCSSHTSFLKIKKNLKKIYLSASTIWCVLQHERKWHKNPGSHHLSGSAPKVNGVYCGRKTNSPNQALVEISSGAILKSFCLPTHQQTDTGDNITTLAEGMVEWMNMAVWSTAENSCCCQSLVNVQWYFLFQSF